MLHIGDVAETWEWKIVLTLSQNLTEVWIHITGKFSFSKFRETTASFLFFFLFLYLTKCNLSGCFSLINLIVVIYIKKPHEIKFILFSEKKKSLRTENTKSFTKLWLLCLSFSCIIFILKSQVILAVWPWLPEV